MIIKATKKPVTIDCIQWTGDNFEEIRDWCGKEEPNIAELGISSNDIAFLDNGILIIRTLEGNHKAIIGDYIIKGVHGEFYPCKEDIFHKTYDINKEN